MRELEIVYAKCQIVLFLRATWRLALQEFGNWDWNLASALRCIIRVSLSTWDISSILSFFWIG